MIFDILYIIFGIILILVGFIATIISFADPINHLWSVPLMLTGMFFVYIAGNNIIEAKVNERIEEYKIENVMELR